MGDFEFALVYYHRGNKLRPELQEFRLGIQKAQEAIDNSVGSKSMMRNVELIFLLYSKQISVTHISHPNPKGPSSVKLENTGDLSVVHKSNGVSWLNYVLYLF